MKDKDRLARGLAARQAGRGWVDIADVMSVSVPKAKALLAEPLADARKRAAVAGGAHVPPDPKCTQCPCPRSKHTRTTEYHGVTYDDACSVCVEDEYSAYPGTPYQMVYRHKCDAFGRVTTPEERRQSNVERALSGGMTRSTLGAMYQLGIDLGRGTGWAKVQTARQVTRFKRAQKKLRRQEARRSG